MKRLISTALALSLMGGAAAYAQDHRDHDDHGRGGAPPQHQSAPQGGNNRSQQARPTPQSRPQQQSRQPQAQQPFRQPQAQQQFRQPQQQFRQPGYAGRGAYDRGYQQGRVWRSPQRFRGPEYFFPRGYGYQLWNYGMILPSPFFQQDYLLYDYNDYGLQPPPPGFEWIRVGHDALLVRQGDGYILDVARDLFY